VQTGAFAKIIVTCAVMILALWVSFDVFASGTNAVGKFYFYVMIGGGLFGLLSPRKAFYFLLFLTAYLDFFKRLMVLDSGIRSMDLYYVLGIAPATLGGIVFSVLYQIAGGKVVLRPLEGRIVAFTSMVLVAVTGLALFTLRSNVRAFGDTVNGLAYLSLLFIIPFMFRTPEELRRILKLVIILYIPSALHLLNQAFLGLAFWEMDYVKKGFTIEIRQLNEKIFRPFGTLNAASTASLIFSLFAALLIGGGFWSYKTRDTKSPNSYMILRLLGALVFIVGAYRTFSRTGWTLALLAMIFFIAFRRRIFMTAFYGSLAVLLAIILVSSEWMLKNRVLNNLTDAIGKGESDEVQMATRLSTLNDRLESYNSLLHNKRVWTPFGLRFSGYDEMKVRSTVHIHDAFTEMLLKVGFVPTLMGAFGAFWLLRHLHRFVCQEPAGLSRELAISGLACGMGILFGGLVNGAQFTTFPINFFFYFYLSIVVGLMLWRRSETEAATVAAPAMAQVPLAELQGRVRGMGHRRQDLAGSSA
jgi:hypothetical protein